jgi:hypothetical protein
MDFLDKLTDVRALKRRVKILEEQLEMEHDHVGLLNRKIQSKMAEIENLIEIIEGKNGQSN